MSKVLGGVSLSNDIQLELKKQVESFNTKPKLVAIQIGDKKESTIYINRKKVVAQEIGIDFEHIKISSDSDPNNLYQKIDELNNDNGVSGIIVQFPIPEKFDKEKVKSLVSPNKDVDAFHPTNVNMLENNNAELIPPTAKGVLTLLNHYDIEVNNSKVVVIGAGEIAGKPTATLLRNNGANVKVLTKKDENISTFTKEADIIVTATGVKNLISPDDVKEGVVLINIGITRDEDGLHGDYDHEVMMKKAYASTPTPGGTGPMTVAHLMENTLICYKLNSKEKHES